VTNNEFVERLSVLGFSKKSFSEKIGVPYNTVLGWSKSGRTIPFWTQFLLEILMENQTHKTKRKK
jgi:hypothetical protein